MTPLDILNFAEKHYSYIANLRKDNPNAPDLWLKERLKEYIERYDMHSGLCLFLTRHTYSKDIRSILTTAINAALNEKYNVCSSFDRKSDWWCPPPYCILHSTVEDIIRDAIEPRLELINKLKLLLS